VKTAFILTILIGITFLGCSDNFDNNIVSTPTETDNFATSKMNLSDSENLNNSTLERDTRGARTSDLTDLKKLSVSKTINGGITDSLVIDTSYVNYQGRLLYIYAKLKVKEFAFQGTTEFTMIFHPEEATIELFPHMIFDQEVQLSVAYQGIDLQELGYNENADIKFVFISENGDMEIIEDKTAMVNIDEQRIKVTNAKLNHFSRYGWIR
jgi:hypothetical protein